MEKDFDMDTAKTPKRIAESALRGYLSASAGAVVIRRAWETYCEKHDRPDIRLIRNGKTCQIEVDTILQSFGMQWTEETAKALWATLLPFGSDRFRVFLGGTHIYVYDIRPEFGETAAATVVEMVEMVRCPKDEKRGWNHYFSRAFSPERYFGMFPIRSEMPRSTASLARG